MMGFMCEKKDEDFSNLFRNYTFLGMDGEREVVNGLQLLHKFYLLEIGYK